jgi:hypothetical protein
MNPRHSFRVVSVFATLCFLSSCTTAPDQRPLKESARTRSTALSQVPSWTQGDMDFFLHGSMSTEFVPESVLRAFVRIYPDLFPTADLSHFGLIPDSSFGWPIGFSRRKVEHLGGLPSVGINCAACHVTEITASPGAAPVRVLGVYDAERMGYSDAGDYILDTSSSGNSNGGHDYGCGLSPGQQHELIEYLKTL